jgi:hypothetical protein
MAEKKYWKLQKTEENQSFIGITPEKVGEKPQTRLEAQIFYKGEIIKKSVEKYT